MSAHVDTLARSPLAVVEVGLDLAITAWNEGAERQLGFSRQEAMARSIAELLPSPDGAESWRRLLDGDSGEQRLRHARSDGRDVVIAWVHHRVLDARGDAAGVVCIGRDATAEIEASRLHAEHQHILRALVDNLDVIVWACDARGVFTYFDGKSLAAAGMKACWRSR